MCTSCTSAATANVVRDDIYIPSATKVPRTPLARRVSRARIANGNWKNETTRRLLAEINACLFLAVASLHGNFAIRIL